MNDPRLPPPPRAATLINSSGSKQQSNMVPQYDTAPPDERILNSYCQMIFGLGSGKQPPHSNSPPKDLSGFIGLGSGGADGGGVLCTSKPVWGSYLGSQGGGGGGGVNPIVPHPLPVTPVHGL